MLPQTAKPSSLPDLGQVDPGEEGVDRQLLHLEEKMNLGPFRVSCEKGMVEEGDECCLVSIAIPCLSCLCAHRKLPCSIRAQK